MTNLKTIMINDDKNPYFETIENLQGIMAKGKNLYINTNIYDNINDEDTPTPVIQYYYDLLQVEKPSDPNSNDIYLLTSTEYKNFTITIYPLDIEEFAYEQIFSVNNYKLINIYIYEKIRIVDLYNK